MSRSLNMVQLIGNLGRDAETRQTPGGAAVTNFSIATERRWKDQSGEYKTETDWHNVTLWKSEKLAEYLTKGTKLYVEGRLQTRKYEKDGQTHYATDVVASEVILLGGRDGSQERSEPQEPVSRPRQQAARPAEQARPSSSYHDQAGYHDQAEVDDSDLPF